MSGEGTVCGWRAGGWEIQGCECGCGSEKVGDAGEEGGYTEEVDCVGWEGGHCEIGDGDER